MSTTSAQPKIGFIGLGDQSDYDSEERPSGDSLSSEM